MDTLKEYHETLKEHYNKNKPSNPYYSDLRRILGARFQEKRPAFMEFISSVVGKYDIRNCIDVGGGSGDYLDCVKETVTNQYCERMGKAALDDSPTNLHPGTPEPSFLLLDRHTINPNEFLLPFLGVAEGVRLMDLDYSAITQDAGMGSGNILAMLNEVLHLNSAVYNTELLTNLFNADIKYVLVGENQFDPDLQWRLRKFTDEGKLYTMDEVVDLVEGSLHFTSVKLVETALINDLFYFLFEAEQ